MAQSPKSILKYIRFAKFSKPPPVNLVLRHGLFHQLPKTRRVAFLSDVHQLMHDYIIDYFRRHHYQAEAESQFIIR